MAEENIDKILEKHDDNVKHHMGVLTEHFDDKVKLISEQYGSIQDILKSHTQMLASIREDIEVMKLDVEFIKGALKKKVDYDEHASLERRVSLLEAKLSQR